MVREEVDPLNNLGIYYETRFRQSMFHQLILDAQPRKWRDFLLDDFNALFMATLHPLYFTF